MPHSRNCAEAQHHFLVDVQDRHQEQQRPQEVSPVVLAGLGIGAKGAGVVVPHHDDEAWPHDRQQCLEFGR